MNQKKYNDFDTLTLYVKKLKAVEIIESYKTFGWELVEECENKRYEDIVDLTFNRPHKIKNKDELQLLQIYMENNLNAKAKLEKNKHQKSTSFGLIFGVLGLILMLNGFLHIFGVLEGFKLIGGIVIASIGFMFLITTLIVIPKLLNKEHSYFKEKHALYEHEIDEICKKATSLLGGENNE